VIGEERRGPYDRVGLTSYFGGRTPDDLALDPAPFEDPRVTLVTGDRATFIDRSGRMVWTQSRASYAYDALVLATGSYAARPAIEGARLAGCFVYRTIE
ncbi:hypothetical protein SB660_19755, partial [Bacillus sp. SIMBA_005]